MIENASKNLNCFYISWYILGDESKKRSMVLKALIVNSFRAILKRAIHS